MRDQLIGHWFQASSAASVEGKSYGVIQTPAIRQVVAAFDKNASQTAFLSKFPREMCMFGQQLQLAVVDASIRLYGQPRYGTRLLIRRAVDPQDEAGAKEAKEATARFFEEGRAIEARARELLEGKADWQIPVQAGADSIELSNYVDAPLRSAYDTLMAAQLILAWTAFETLAGDLWEAAVNAHPQTLAALRGTKDQSLTDEDKSLPMSFLERNHYDLRNKMGTILRMHRCKFTTVDEIAKSYRSAFPERSNLNSKQFWEHQDMRTTAAIRNLLVHRSGIVDAEFKNKTGADSRLSAWNLNEQFFLDGDLLQQLLRGLFGFSAALIRAVDDWIIANP